MWQGCQYIIRKDARGKSEVMTEFILRLKLLKKLHFTYVYKSNNIPSHVYITL